jgi:CRP-like cAMP-binding protein
VSQNKKGMRENVEMPSLFAGLTSEQTKLIIQSAEIRKVLATDTIVNAGSSATELFHLSQGTAKYFRVTRGGDEVLLWWLSRGDTFGIGTLLTEELQYIATAEAVDNCELLVWKKDQIRQLADRYPLLTENALHIVLYYLAAYADRVVGLITETAEERLARTLLQLSYRVGSVQSGGVELAITNEALSRLANVSPFTASRQLKKWHRAGVINKSRKKIHLASPESLLLD